MLEHACSQNKRFFTLLGIALLISVNSILPFDTGFCIAQESETAPLAARSLLLDGQVLGQRVVVVGERGHILISDDQGHSWVQQPVPTRTTLTSVFFIDDTIGWAAGHDSVILKTQDGGQHWQAVYADPDDQRPILDLWFRNKQQGYAIGGYGLFLTTNDGGQSWNVFDFDPATLRSYSPDHIATWSEKPEEETWEIDYHLNQLSATARGRLYIAAEAGHLYRSDDGSHSWLSLPSPYGGSFYGSLVLSENRLLLFGLRGHLFSSEDAGVTWEERQTGVASTLNDGIRLKDGRIILAGQDGTVLISSDLGKSFQLYAQPDRSDIAKVLVLDQNTLLLIGELGVSRISLAPPSTERLP
ncbi:MAG: hypothetical protein JRE16_02680 [Deltaproteobacteria bacterium]|jgi:photosystem II stability/assembly factor-like uncharacterized protein|nr:hypothetical protein [Deltaproteobacteria bacterium]